MNGETLQATVERYNSFVDARRSIPISANRRRNTKFKHRRSMLPGDTVIVHDTRAGLRINAKLPGDRHAGASDSRTLLRRRIRRRVQSTRHGSLRHPGLHLRQRRGEAAAHERGVRSRSRGRHPRLTLTLTIRLLSKSIVRAKMIFEKEEKMSRNQIRIEFESKTPFAGGMSFGNVGPYERLLGMASFRRSIPMKKSCRLFATWSLRRATPKGWSSSKPFSILSSRSI